VHRACIYRRGIASPLRVSCFIFRRLTKGQNMSESVQSSRETSGTTALNALLQQRYGASLGLETQSSSLPENDVIEALLNHRSVRRYSDRALPDNIIQTIIAAAQSASSSSNLQAWSVVAVRDSARKERLAAFAGNQKHITTAPLLLVFIADLSRLRGVSETAGTKGDALEYLESLLLGVIDAALAAQNAVVALESLGLGSCYIGAMRNKPEEVARELALPSEAFAVFGLTVGYPAEEVKTDIKPRLSQDVVVHLEQYQAPAPGALAAYDAAIHAFQRLQKMPDQNWTEQAASRVRGPESLSGRDRLFSALQILGFGLK
jgi:nitroreductase